MLHPLAKAYIDATRPKMSIFGLLLFLASAQYVHARWMDPLLWLTAMTIVPSICAIVITNDYIDRDHDRKKQRTLASEHPTTTLAVALSLWTIALLLILWIYTLNSTTAAILGVMSGIGLIYSWMRRVPLLSGLAVSLCYALLCPLAYQFDTAQTNPLHIAAATLTVFCAVHGRETLADLDDQHIDQGYKATMVVTLGALNARVIMALVFTLGWLGAIVTAPLMLLTLPIYITLMRTVAADPANTTLGYKLVDTMTLCFVVAMVIWSCFYTG